VFSLAFRWLSDRSLTVKSWRSFIERRVVVLNRINAIAIVVVLLAAGRLVSAQGNAQIERGMKVYTDQKCAVCHSIAGKGNAKGALDDVGSRLTPDEIRAWLANPAEMTKKTKAERKPPMRAYPNLAKEDVDALVAYLLSLKK
jgi:mono/diheme cytochrome c family protein